MRVAALKLAVFLLSLLPLGWYGWGAWYDALGANPVEAVTRGLGDWALRFLLITLAVIIIAVGICAVAVLMNIE